MEIQEAVRAAIREVLNKVVPYKKQDNLFKDITKAVKDELFEWALKNSPNGLAAARRLGVTKNTLYGHLKK